MINDLRKYLLLFFILSLMNPKISGQKIKVTRDLRLITEIGAAKNLGNSWEIGIFGKCWLDKNISEFSEIDLEATIGFRPYQFLLAEAGYRWSRSKDNFNNFNTRNRFSGSLDFIARIERYRFDFRTCFQNIDDENQWDDDSRTSKNILRNRLQIKYNIRKSKLTPFLLTEHYGRLYSNDDYGLKIKSEIGTTYRINKHHELKVYYRVDRELNNENPYLLYSLGVSYLAGF